MRHPNDAALDTVREIGHSIFRDILTACKWVYVGDLPHGLDRMTVEKGHYLTDVPTYSRRRSESPVIPGSLFWR